MEAFIWPCKTTSHYRSHLFYKTHDTMSTEHYLPYWWTESPDHRKKRKTFSSVCSVENLAHDALHYACRFIYWQGIALNFFTDLSSRWALHTNNDCWDIQPSRLLFSRDHLSTKAVNVREMPKQSIDKVLPIRPIRRTGFRPIRSDILPHCRMVAACTA